MQGKVTCRNDEQIRLRLVDQGRVQRPVRLHFSRNMRIVSRNTLFNQCGNESFWHLMDDDTVNCTRSKSEVRRTAIDQVCTIRSARGLGLTGPGFHEGHARTKLAAKSERVRSRRCRSDRLIPEFKFCVISVEEVRTMYCCLVR
jgi:hypothetical protein